MAAMYPVIFCLLLLMCSGQKTGMSSYRSMLSDETTEIPYWGGDCADLYLNGYKRSGIYSIWPSNWERPFEVYCDMRTDGGGWTMIQRRGDYFGFPEDYFLRTWDEYKHGFGDLTKEFWLGNDKIFALTRQTAYQLRIDLWDDEENMTYAKYSRFWIADETDLYRLNVGGYSGTAGNSMAIHNRNQFTTKDRDVKDCVKTYKGAWWNSIFCHQANLNGLNLKGPTSSYADGIAWYHWRGFYYSLSFTELKIRPREFLRLP